MERLLLRAAHGECFNEELKDVIELYGNDFNHSQLKSQLQILNTQGKQFSQGKVSLVGYTSKAGGGTFIAIRSCKTCIVMPATNAKVNICFLALKRVKTFLRSSMNQSRLNHLMIFYVHKD